MACPSGQNVQLTPVNSSRITFLFSGFVVTIVCAKAQHQKKDSSTPRVIFFFIIVIFFAKLSIIFYIYFSMILKIFFLNKKSPKILLGLFVKSIIFLFDSKFLGCCECSLRNFNKISSRFIARNINCLLIESIFFGKHYLS